MSATWTPGSLHSIVDEHRRDAMSPLDVQVVDLECQVAAARLDGLRDGVEVLLRERLTSVQPVLGGEGRLEVLVGLVLELERD